MLKNHSKTFVSSLLFVTASIVSPAWSTDRYVPGQYSTIQAAIDSANEHDNIIITSSRTEDFTVNKNHLWFESNPVSTITTSTIVVAANGTVFYNVNFYTPYNSSRVFRINSDVEYTLISSCDFSSGNSSAWVIDDYGAYDVWVENCNFYNYYHTIDSYNSCILFFNGCDHYSSGGSAVNWYGNKDNTVSGTSSLSTYYSSMYGGSGITSSWWSTSLDHEVSTLGTFYSAGNARAITADGDDVKLYVYTGNTFNTCSPDAWSLTNGASLESESPNNTFDYGCPHP